MQDKKCCYNCNHYQRGRCDVLDSALLVMARAVCSKPEMVNISSCVVIKDDFNNKFYCNEFKSVALGGEV